MNQLVLNENEKAALILMLDTFIAYSDDTETKTYMVGLLNTIITNTLCRYQDLVCLKSMLAEYETLLSLQMKRELKIVPINLAILKKIEESLPKIKSLDKHESI